MDVILRRLASRHSVVLRAWRNLKIVICDQACKRFPLWRLFGEDEADHRAILFDLARRLGVVEIQDDLRSGGNSLDGTGFPSHDARPRNKSAEPGSPNTLAAAVRTVTASATLKPAAVVVDRHVRLHPYHKALTLKYGVLCRLDAQTLAFLPGQLMLRGASRRRRHNEDIDVMNDATIAGPRLGHLHILVFGKSGINLEEVVLIRPCGFKSELFRHLQDQIRLADLPPFDNLGPRRSVMWIAFRRPAVSPGLDRIDLRLGQAAVVRELPRARIGVPGRHLAADDFFADGLGPGARVFVTQQRHRSRLARTMAFGAVLEKDRRDVFAKSDILRR